MLTPPTLRRVVPCSMLALMSATACDGKVALEVPSASAGSARVPDRLQLDVLPESPARGDPLEFLGRETFICARRHEAAVACFGDFVMPIKPRQRRYGDPDLRKKPYSEVPLALLGFEPDALSGDQFGRCMLDESGGIRCWPSENEAVPTVQSGLADIVDVAYNSHGCAVRKDGGISCWFAGQCRSSDSGSVESWDTPRKIRGVSDAVAVSVGVRLSCALLRSGGVSCWGYVDGTENLETCVDEEAVPVAGIEDAVEIAVGGREACAVLRSGGVKCWGANEGRVVDPQGELLATFAEPRQIEGLPPVVELEAVYGAMIALTTEGQVWTWGAYLSRDIEKPEMRRVPEIDAAIDIVAGNNFGCALLPDHSLRCFGPRIEWRPNKEERPPFESRDAWRNAREYEIFYDWKTAPDPIEEENRVADSIIEPALEVIRECWRDPAAEACTTGLPRDRVARERILAGIEEAVDGRRPRAEESLQFGYSETWLDPWPDPTRAKTSIFVSYRAVGRPWLARDGKIELERVDGRWILVEMSTRPADGDSDEATPQ